MKELISSSDPITQDVLDDIEDLKDAIHLGNSLAAVTMLNGDKYNVDHYKPTIKFI